MYRSALALLSVFLASCAGFGWDPGQKLKTFFWDMQKEMRVPGEKLLVHPDAVWNEFNCGKKVRPFVSVEKQELLPPETYPGEEFNHRFIYVMCPVGPARVITGNLYRRVYYKGRMIFQDVSKGFKIKPGKWNVDAFIKVPEQAKVGIYSVEVSFSSAQTQFIKSQNLVVIDRR